MHYYLLVSLDWGPCFAISRIYVKEFLDGTYLTLTSTKFAPMLTSTLWGKLADTYDREKFVPLGFLAAPALALIGFTQVLYVQILVAIANLMETAA